MEGCVINAFRDDVAKWNVRRIGLAMTVQMRNEGETTWGGSLVAFGMVGWGQMFRGL